VDEQEEEDDEPRTDDEFDRKSRFLYPSMILFSSYIAIEFIDDELEINSVSFPYRRDPDFSVALEEEARLLQEIAESVSRRAQGMRAVEMNSTLEENCILSKEISQPRATDMPLWRVNCWVRLDILRSCINVAH
jgi:hypothetical protein